MTRKEYKEILDYELYNGRKLSIVDKIRIKYFQPNTNCMYLARKMWFKYTLGGIQRIQSKLIYLKILHKFGCIIYANITVGKGFYIAHPVGIVMGRCTVGENFTIYQNTTIGVSHPGDEAKGFFPHIGNNVRLSSGSCILGNVNICDDVLIGAQSLVIKSINEAGTYVGCPVRKL